MQKKPIARNALALLLSLLCVFLFACAPGEPGLPSGNDTTVTGNGDSQSDTDAVTPAKDAASLAAAILEKGDFSEELSAMKESKIAATYAIDAATLVSGSSYFSGSGAYPDEVVVLTADSDAHAADMKAAMERYLESQRATWADYRPAEAPKLEAPVLVLEGNTVVFCVCGNADTVRTFLQSYFAS